MSVIDLSIYRATGVRVDYRDGLSWHLHELHMANKAVEETLNLVKDWPLRKAYKPWFPDGAA